MVENIITNKIERIKNVNRMAKGKLYSSPFHVESIRYMYAIEHETGYYAGPGEKNKCPFYNDYTKMCTLSSGKNRKKCEPWKCKYQTIEATEKVLKEQAEQEELKAKINELKQLAKKIERRTKKAEIELESKDLSEKEKKDIKKSLHKKEKDLKAIQSQLDSTIEDLKKISKVNVRTEKSGFKK